MQPHQYSRKLFHRCHFTNNVHATNKPTNLNVSIHLRKKAKWPDKNSFNLVIRTLSVAKLHSINGAAGVMRTGPLYPQQISHSLTWDRIHTAAAVVSYGTSVCTQDSDGREGGTSGRSTSIHATPFCDCWNNKCRFHNHTYVFLIPLQASLLSVIQR